MLKVFECPHCHRPIETNQAAGDEIACPYCEEGFTLRASHEVQKSAAREALFRIAIPLGYVLFVAVPLGLTVWFFVNRAEQQQKEAVAAAEAAETAATEARKRASDAKPPAPPIVRPPRKPMVGTPGNPGATEPDPREEPEPKVTEPVGTGSKDPKEADPKVREPKPKVELVLAPEPHEVPEVEIAPAPRVSGWKLPPMDYVSPWQKVGAVDLRVAGVAILRVPIADAKEQVRESAQPALVVVVEVRMNTSTKKRDLLSWTYGQNRYMVGFTASGKDLPHFEIPLGSKVNSGLPLKQPIPSDGDTVRDLLVFQVPSEGAGELSLRLDGQRFGEPVDVWVKIPTTAWKK